MTLLWCNACGGAMDPGEALRVLPSNGGQPFHIHRPAVSAPCLRKAGTILDSAIELADPLAARLFDAATTTYATADVAGAVSFQGRSRADTPAAPVPPPSIRKDVIS